MPRLVVYSVLNAITGSCLAAFLEGINPEIIVNDIAMITRTIAAFVGSTAFTS